MADVITEEMRKQLIKKLPYLTRLTLLQGDDKFGLRAGETAIKISSGPMRLKCGVTYHAKDGKTYGRVIFIPYGMLDHESIQVTRKLLNSNAK